MEGGRGKCLACSRGRVRPSRPKTPRTSPPPPGVHAGLSRCPWGRPPSAAGPHLTLRAGWAGPVSRKKSWLLFQGFPLSSGGSCRSPRPPRIRQTALRRPQLPTRAPPSSREVVGCGIPPVWFQQRPGIAQAADFHSTLSPGPSCTAAMRASLQDPQDEGKYTQERVRDGGRQGTGLGTVVEGPRVTWQALSPVGTGETERHAQQMAQCPEGLRARRRDSTTEHSRSLLGTGCVPSWHRQCAFSVQIPSVKQRRLEILLLPPGVSRNTGCSGPGSGVQPRPSSGSGSKVNT